MRLVLSATVIVSVMLACAINPHVQTEASAKGAAVGRSARTYAAASPAMEADYRLGYGDEIEVKFFNNSEYNEVVQVRPDGRISLQRIEDIRVVGMTLAGLDELITHAYAEILVDPEVTVFLRSSAGRRVYVMGEVRQPGSYELVRGMSVLRAVAAAGGPELGAKMNSVMLLRRSEQRGLTAERLDLSVGNIDKMMANDAALQPYDLIYVPKTVIADVDAWISQVYRIVLTPMDVTSRVLYYQALFNNTSKK